MEAKNSGVSTGKPKRVLKNWSDDQKLECLKQLFSGSQNVDVVRRYRVPESTLRGWSNDIKKVVSEGNKKEKKKRKIFKFLSEMEIREPGHKMTDGEIKQQCLDIINSVMKGRIKKRNEESTTSYTDAVPLNLSSDDDTSQRVIDDNRLKSSGVDILYMNCRSTILGSLPHHQQPDDKGSRMHRTDYFNSSPCNSTEYAVPLNLSSDLCYEESPIDYSMKSTRK